MARKILRDHGLACGQALQQRASEVRKSDFGRTELRSHRCGQPGIALLHLGPQRGQSRLGNR
jgi:hypothetical protein